MQLTLDAAASHALKVQGLDALESHDARFLDTMRAAAIKISAEKGMVSSDDLRVLASEMGLSPVHPNSWGSLFRGPKWRVIGRKKSAVPSNHYREIRVWHYEP